jgi:hypothetical protein
VTHSDQTPEADKPAETVSRINKEQGSKVSRINRKDRPAEDPYIQSIDKT